eukprot:scaffold1839_cov382-Prasinococcus_capsulatus_cf.AAC.38
MSAEIEEFSNADKPLVIQYQVKHEQKLDCGGGYIKLLPKIADMTEFKGETDYNIMFGPDVCGLSTKRVHAIFNYKGKNLLTKKEVKCETDQLSHVYTFVVKPDNTYEILIDLESKQTGSLYDDWDFLPPKMIEVRAQATRTVVSVTATLFAKAMPKFGVAHSCSPSNDPEATKPEDWDERPKIVDPTDVKPDGWDDIPEKIADPEAEKPEDWDDEDDGEWEPPMIDNPEYKGEWVPKMIDNPDYQGIWKPPEIPNPEFEDDPNLYKYDGERAFKYVGFELWQVKSGTIFDNILVTDDIDYAKEFASKTWGAMKDAEKEMFDKIEEERKAEEEAERKRAEEERAALEDEEDDEDDDEDFEDEDEDEETAGATHDEL